MDDDKVKIYTPTVIDESPFPNQEPQSLSVSQSNAQGIYSPQVTQNQLFPIKRVAQELLSTSLNTKSRKITQPYEFTETGALQIGRYTIGVNGDVMISPSGIVSRDSAGNTTFALDGESGDAIFAGELRTGATITGSVLITDAGFIELLDANGIPSIFIGYLPT